MTGNRLSFLRNKRAIWRRKNRENQSRKKKKRKKKQTNKTTAVS